MGGLSGLLFSLVQEGPYRKQCMKINRILNPGLRILTKWPFAALASPGPHLVISALVLACLFVPGVLSDAFALEFSVKGKIDVVTYAMATNSIVNQDPSRNYEVLYSNGKWHIKLGRGEQFLRNEVSFNKTNIYYLDLFDISKIDMSEAPTNVTTPPNIGIGIIQNDNGRIPPHQPFAHQLSPLWLAFLSSDKLVKNGKISTMEPVASHFTIGLSYGFYDLGLHFSQKIEYTYLSGNYPLPDNLWFIEDGKVKFLKASQEKEGVPMPEPYSRGWTNAYYHIVDTTNIYNIVIPTKSVLSVYTPAQKGKYLDKPILDYEYVITATNISNTIDDKSFIPTFEGPIDMHDKRFLPDGLPHVGYITNKWLSKSEVKKLPEYKNTVREKWLKWMEDRVNEIKNYGK